MPPDSRHATRPLDADRQPAGARAPCRSSRTPRRSAPRRGSSAPASPRSTVQPRASLMRPPTSRSICGDVSGNRLSARRADTRNVRDVCVAEVREDRARRSPRRRAARGRPARSSRRRTRARRRSRTVVPVGVRRRARSRSAPSARAPRARRVRLVAVAQVARQPGDEPRPVVPLEGDLLVVNDDASCHLNVRSSRPVTSRIRSIEHRACAAAMAADAPRSRSCPEARCRSSRRRERSPRPACASPGRGGWPGASENVACFSRTTVARSSVRGARARQRVGDFARRERDQLVARHRASARRRRSTPATGATRASPKTRPLVEDPLHRRVRAGRRTARPSRRGRTRDSRSRSASTPSPLASATIGASCAAARPRTACRSACHGTAAMTRARVDALAADVDARRRRPSFDDDARERVGAHLAAVRLDEGARRLGVHLVQRARRQHQRRRPSGRARTSRASTRTNGAAAASSVD